MPTNFLDELNREHHVEVSDDHYVRKVEMLALVGCPAVDDYLMRCWKLIVDSYLMMRIA